MDMAASPDLIAGTEFRVIMVKEREAREDLNLQFRLPSQWRASEVRGRTRDVMLLDEGNFRLVGAHTGRMTSQYPNLSSIPRVTFEPGVDDEAMQMICAKAGEPTSMTDPYALLKHRDRPYGDKRSLAYA
jgi:hypothetical protein